jgi:hypothetical protein
MTAEIFVGQAMTTKRTAPMMLASIGPERSETVRLSSEPDVIEVDYFKCGNSESN